MSYSAQRTANISLSNIEDQIAALLYATGMASDSEDISNFEFGEITKSVDGKDVIPITFDVVKRKGGAKSSNGSEGT